FLGQGSVFYTYLNDGQPVIAAVNMEGEEIWAVEGALLGAVSRQGTRLAAVQGNRLTVYDSLGYILWETPLPFEIKSVMFNPQNFNRILVYGNTEGAKENLYYFDMAEDLLWKRRIGDESIFTFTGNGQHIVTSSWRHYKDDFSRMILLDQDGVELISWEVAMRVERLLISGQPLYVIVSGDDGYIDLINLESMLGVTGINGNDAPALPIYNPVSTIRRIAESGIRLFFADEAANLVPVTRSVIHTENPIQTAIDELIRGPAWGSALFRTIPTEAVDVEVIFTPENGRLYLDLSPELAQLSGATQSIAALQSLLLTVSSFPEVAEIYLTVSGKPIEVFGDGISLEQPLSPQRWERPLFIPIRSGERYHLLIREAEELIAGDLSLEMFIDTVLRFSRDLHLVPTDLRVIDLHITPEQVQINLGRSFRNLFPEDGGEKERLRAALVLDALFMTVFENHRPQRVEILLENETWLPPAGYPSLNRFFRQPYYINPE
ncbi:MAG TPA: GerMN domain-containing protein, partial [Candidatus Limnocylindrales bacterium]|nr:GerMN domain-containing protein [Candidatus Limnocylindrales bacterium]